MAKGIKTGGRVAGTPNKVTAELKETILNALDGVGGVEYLQRKAESHPAAFLALVGKVLPMTIAGEGKDGAIVVEITRFGSNPAP
jgi:hypothetical protein